MEIEIKKECCLHILDLQYMIWESYYTGKERDKLDHVTLPVFISYLKQLGADRTLKEIIFDSETVISDKNAQDNLQTPTGYCKLQDLENIFSENGFQVQITIL